MNSLPGKTFKLTCFCSGLRNSHDVLAQFGERLSLELHRTGACDTRLQHYHAVRRCANHVAPFDLWVCSSIDVRCNNSFCFSVFKENAREIASWTSTINTDALLHPLKSLSLKPFIYSFVKTVADRCSFTNWL